MGKYRVWANSVSHVYLDVEAASEEDAIAIAEEADGGDFIDVGFGYFEITDAIKQDE